MKKYFWGLTCLLLTILAFNAPASANEQISEQTFLRFSKIAGFKDQYNQMIRILSTNFQQGMVAGFQNGMKGKDIPENVKEKLYPMVNEASENIETGFENIFKKEVKFDDLVKKVYLPVYRKHFSESELIELIKFYNSPIGKKVSKLSINRKIRAITQ